MLHLGITVNWEDNTFGQFDDLWQPSKVDKSLILFRKSLLNIWFGKLDQHRTVRSRFLAAGHFQGVYGFYLLYGPPILRLCWFSICIFNLIFINFQWQQIWGQRLNDAFSFTIKITWSSRSNRSITPMRKRWTTADES